MPLPADLCICLPCAIHDPAMAQHRAVRCNAAGWQRWSAGWTGTSRGTGRRPPYTDRQASCSSGRSSADTAHMGGTGVEPHVHDVGVFAANQIAPHSQTSMSLGMMSLASYLYQASLPSLRNRSADSLDGSIGNVVLAALLAVEYRDRHAPDALTADAPVAAVAHHARACGHGPRPAATCTLSIAL